MEKKTIVFVSHSSGLYGAERSLLDLVVGLRDNFRVLVVVPKEGPFVEELRQAGIEYIIQNHKSWVGNGRRLPRILFRACVTLFSLFSLVKALEQYSPDLIYSNTITKPIGALLALCLKVPHIWHVREFVQEDFGQEYDFGNRMTFRLVEKTSAKMICNSYAVRKKMADYLPQDRLKVVYNGVLNDGDSRSSLSKSLDFVKGMRLRLCLVGQLHVGKGQEDALRAIKILVNDGVDAELHLVGAGYDTYLQALKAIVRNLDLEDRVIFAGYQANGVGYMADAHISLVCSKCEAFGRVVVESMSVGTPVVATDSGGIPEIIEDGETGMLYSPGDCRMLAEKILCLARDPALYTMVSSRGLEQVYQKFTRTKYVKSITSVIEEVFEK